MVLIVDVCGYPKWCLRLRLSTPMLIIWFFGVLDCICGDCVH